MGPQLQQGKSKQQELESAEYRKKTVVDACVQHTLSLLYGPDPIPGTSATLDAPVFYCHLIKVTPDRLSQRPVLQAVLDLIRLTDEINWYNHDS